MTLTVHAPDGVGGGRPGDDLADLLLTALGSGWTLADGDVVAVTSKVVSKAEGRVRAGDRDEAARPRRPSASSPGAAAPSSCATGSA